MVEAYVEPRGGEERVDRVGSVEWLEGSERWRSVEGGRRW